MFRCLTRFYKRAKRMVVTAVTVLLRRVAGRARQAWASHGSKVRTDPPYAAVIAIVLGGAFGVVPPKEVLAAAVAAALGVVMTGRNRPDSHPRRDMNRWNDDMDLF